ncbi:MAG: hypothetical protein JO372_16660, partial [Solirubrobacterales bacterium]|nr:hypothetical protein [Solirubrobacterales bacterium]
GALGLAVLGTIATNRTHAFETAHHPLVASLIAGYHLAFEIGAVSVAVGILAALALLRAPQSRKPEIVEEREARAHREYVPDLERQAA